MLQVARKISRRMIFPLALALASGCSGPDVRLYDGQARLVNDVGTLSWDREIERLTIDGKAVPIDASSVQLLAGSHNIHYVGSAYKVGRRVGQTRLVIKKGHEYRIRFISCYSWIWCSRSYAAAMWINDETENEIVHGSKTLVRARNYVYGATDTDAEVEASDPSLSRIQRENILAGDSNAEARYRKSFRVAGANEKFFLLCLSATGGHVKAAEQLGMMYTYGIDGFPVSDHKARVWYQHANAIRESADSSVINDQDNIGQSNLILECDASP